MRIELLPKDLTYYKANLHSHSTLSDGCVTPEEMKAAYKEKGYSILAENMILEDGKFYPMMKVSPKGMGTGTEIQDEDTESMDLLGPYLLQNQNPVLLAYIRQEIQVKEGILEGLKKQEQKEKLLLRRQEIEKELVLLKNTVQKWY